MSVLKGPILLLATALLWGFAFVAQTTASQQVEPFTFNASRNFVGVAFLLFVIALRKKNGQDKAPQTNSDANGYTVRTLLVSGFLCGTVLCAASFLQQSGITAYPDEAAASGRSGFVTATYMVMVAVIMSLSGKRPHPLVFASVAIALLGMYLLCVPEGFESVYWGDWLVFASALGYALHIVVIDRYTAVDGVRLSCVQLLASGCISLVCALIFEQPTAQNVLAALIPILYAGICSDGIAYTLQIVGQKYTDATVASVIMSLESVFAAFGGWLLLHETLSLVELTGCALVFAAVIVSQLPSFLENARKRV